ncbi:hypothetical protein FRC15_011288 [Serendipita sp. 397]|nr:hypothetical protein FRC15_011288 [Serendipita sp. 397]
MEPSAAKRRGYLLHEHDITTQCRHSSGPPSSGTKVPLHTTTTMTKGDTIMMRSRYDDPFMRNYTTTTRQTRTRTTSTCSTATSCSAVSTTTSSSFSRSSTDSLSWDTRRDSHEVREYRKPIQAGHPLVSCETGGEAADERFLSANPSFVSQRFTRRDIPFPGPRSASPSPIHEKGPGDRRPVWGRQVPTRTYSTPTKPSPEVVKPSYQQRTQSLHEDSLRSRGLHVKTQFLLPTIMVTAPSSPSYDPTSSTYPSMAPGRESHVTQNRYNNNNLTVDHHMRALPKHHPPSPSPPSPHCIETDSDEEDNISLAELKRLLKESRRGTS